MARLGRRTPIKPHYGIPPAVRLYTRFYLPASTATTKISPAVDASWDVSSSLTRAMMSVTSIADPMATLSFADADATDQSIVLRQFVSPPLVAGQTITAAQSIKVQVLCKERATTCNMILNIGVRVIASDGTTVQKTVLVVTSSGSEFSAAALTNRIFTVTSAAGDYTVVAGDRIVVEFGASGDPGGGSDHDFDLRFGDSAADDLPVADDSITDYRPWFQLADNLSFTAEAAVASTGGARSVMIGGSIAAMNSGGARTIFISGSLA